MKLGFTFISLCSFPKHSMIWYEPHQWKRKKQLESEMCTTAVWYSERKKMFSRKYIVQIKEMWIELLFSIKTNTDDNTNNGNFPHCNWFFCSILHQHRAKKNYFTLFGSLTRQVHNKMKAWLPRSDDHTVWKYSIYWHVANFPEKQ